MIDPVVNKIQNHPKYLELRKKRNAFGWGLTLLMMVVYYGYIALIAFNKPFLAQPIGAGVTSLGRMVRNRSPGLPPPAPTSPLPPTRSRWPSVIPAGIFT